MDLALLNVEIDAVDGGERAVLFSQVLNPDHSWPPRKHGRHHPRSRSALRRGSANGAHGRFRLSDEHRRASGNHFTSTSAIFTRPISGIIAACLSRPPRASRKCVASAGNWLNV